MQQTAHLSHVSLERRSARKITGPEGVREVSVREEIIVFHRERRIWRLVNRVNVLRGRAVEHFDVVFARVIIHVLNQLIQILRNKRVLLVLYIYLLVMFLCTLKVKRALLYWKSQPQGMNNSLVLNDLARCTINSTNRSARCFTFISNKRGSSWIGGSPLAKNY